MRTFMEIGSSPVYEDCAQVGAPDYPERSRAECAVFRRQLEREFPNAPDGCYITVKSFPHDFGTYREVCVVYDDENEGECDYAYALEGETPERWDDEAKAELAARGFPVNEL